MLKSAILSHSLRMMSSSERTYDSAIEKLMSLQSNVDVLKNAERRKKLNITATKIYLNRLDIEVSDLKKLNIIHVAGTKGKGSTCALTESILRHVGHTTGFFSSPHLMEVRERIRLNGRVLSREMFSHYFYEVWDRLNAVKHEDTDICPQFPSFFKFLVVMAYYVFLKEGVDVAIMEVGLGGRYDCTNVVPEPIVTGITHLGYDHISVLGNTIESIAWQKAGIIKSDVPVYTVPQFYTESYGVLEEESDRNNIKLIKVPALSAYPNYNMENIAETWSDNISLALQLSSQWLSKCGAPDVKVAPGEPFIIPQDFLVGIRHCQWPGRNHVIHRGHVAYYLDGAHTKVSITMCTKWFKSKTNNGKRKILIANTTKDRKVSFFIEIIKQQVELDQVLFCPNIASNNFVVKDCEWPGTIKESLKQTAHDNRNVWSHAYPNIPAHSFDSVEEAIWHIESLEGGSDVLITGSLHLIGAALLILVPRFLDTDGFQAVSGLVH